MVVALQQYPPLSGSAEPDSNAGLHSPRAPHHCTHRDGEAQPGHSILYSLFWPGAQEQRDGPVTQSLSLDVQVPGTAQHGFQLLLQPSTHPRGERTAKRVWDVQRGTG